MIIHLDFETYSSVPINKAGAQAYFRSPDFEILLCAYSIDSAPVMILDLTVPEERDYFNNVLGPLLLAPNTIISAYNAAFEAGCIAQHFGLGSYTPSYAAKFRCTMLHGLYAGYTAGLDATGKALGLPADKQKLSIGKALIRYFCVPCKPTKSNSNRIRNLPKHDPDKWELFKEYCVQDVVTEIEIEKRLSAFPVPDFIEKQWQTDLIINDRGVAVDMDFVAGALELGTIENEALKAEAVEITGLHNPNSVRQLSQWLEDQNGTEVSNLRKETVSKMLACDANSPAVKRMLEIRQELGKTSTKKYNAIETCVCHDGRVRGLLQFYGANRTGRWAGRLVQVQNLPRTYTEPLGLARGLVKTRKLDALKIIYGSVNDTLSQLIRTAFVASDGHVLIDADFSAIEARVISWLAGEEWRLQVFRDGGDIYCASASQMFHCNVVKGGENGHLRQKGKVAELALGYQGGAGALIAMGAIDMGLSEDELPDIVQRWRTANSKIRDLWYAMDSAAIQVINNGGYLKVKNLIVAREYDATQGIPVLSITLPSTRKLYYVNPAISTNKWGNQSISYYGQNQSKKSWERIETYGGKLIENCVQAIARDCLAVAIERLEAAGLPIVFHVHDECVIDVAPFGESSEQMLSKVVDIMSTPILWAPGLPLGADGWVGTFFKKD